MEDTSKSTAEERAAEALRFARERLGPASEISLSEPAAQVRVLARLRSGGELADAVLAEMHRAAAGNPKVADEFVAYFLGDLLRMGQRVQSSALRRFLDTGDLVQSVLGDVWAELRSLRFETRAGFLAYLSRRLSWKTADKSRALGAAKRREDQRLDGDAEELELWTEGSSPLEEAAAEEERERLALALLRLSERDRELIQLHLSGLSLEEIAERTELSYDACRMALTRAVRRAGRLA